MIAISLLEPADILLPTDWVRPLSFECVMSGETPVETRHVYSGAPHNNVRWVQACDVFGPCWLNRAFGDVTAACGRYEAVRGFLPPSHIWLNWKRTTP